MRTYTDQDDGASVSLACGDSFRVRLAEKRVAGFRWHVGSLDPSVLEVTHEAFDPPDPLRPGAGGEHVWELTGRRRGHSQLRLDYRRSFGSRAAARTFSLAVSVT